MQCFDFFLQSSDKLLHTGLLVARSFRLHHSQEERSFIVEHLLEICVDSLESALAAQKGGADRLELCANLIIGGTSPCPALIHQVQEAIDIPVNVLLRPRFGDFCFTPAEQDAIVWEVKTCRQMGVNGVVLGGLTPEGRLDHALLSRCINAAGPSLHCTLHRAFDLCRDPFEALEDAIALGFDTILTSGQQAKAETGIHLLAQLIEKANGRISILAGSGVNPENMPALAAAGVRQFHFSAKKPAASPMIFRREGVPMGLAVADEYLREYTDAQLVAQAKAVLRAL